MRDASAWDEAYTSGQYRERWHREHPSRELSTVVAAGLIPDASAVLDIGCGAGSEAVFLATRGHKATGVDLSAEALALAAATAEAAGVDVAWKVGDALKLPVEDGSIDFAFDRGCFHHVQPEDRPKYADEIARVLRAGGRLFLRGFDSTGQEDSHFIAVTQEAIDLAFAGDRFACGTVEVLAPETREDERVFRGVFITRR